METSRDPYQLLKFIQKLKRKKKKFSHKEKKRLNLDGNFKLSRIVNRRDFHYKIERSIKEKSRNRGKRNLLRYPYYADLKNGLIIQIPFREFKTVEGFKFYRFVDWMDKSIIERYGVPDGDYIIHGCSRGAGRIDHLYQVSLIRFKITNGRFDDGYLPKRSFHKTKEHGLKDKKISELYKVFLIFRDLKERI